MKYPGCINCFDEGVSQLFYGGCNNSKCECHSPQEPTKEGWEENFDELLAHFRDSGEGEKTFMNNVRRKPNTELEKEIKSFIRSLLLEERKRTEKAFGGCTKCYGKGYATQREVLSGGHGSSEIYKVLNPVLPCDCDRGTQIKKYLTQ